MVLTTISLAVLMIASLAYSTLICMKAERQRRAASPVRIHKQ